VRIHGSSRVPEPVELAVFIGLSFLWPHP
jgi:hypothetical protein